MTKQLRFNKIVMILLALALVPVFAQATHDNSVCEETTITRDDVISFVIFTKSLPTEIVEGQRLRVPTLVTFNPGVKSEQLTLEVGMYPADSPQAFSIVKSQVGSVVTATRNCVAGEDFVDTVHVFTNALPANTVTPASITEFEIEAPVDAYLNEGGKRDYVIQMVLFKNCYRQCAESTGSIPIAWTSVPVKLVDAPNAVADQANDGVQNGDETDIDCGGSTGVVCPAGFACNVDEECPSNLECLRVAGSDHKVCASPSNPDVGGVGGALGGSRPGAALWLGLGGIVLVGFAYNRWRKRR